jgi:hypothetical protein
LPLLRAFSSVQADFQGPVLAHDLNGIPIAYTHYFAREGGVLGIGGLRKYGNNED